MATPSDQSAQPGCRTQSPRLCTAVLLDFSCCKPVALLCFCSSVCFSNFCPLGCKLFFNNSFGDVFCPLDSIFSCFWALKNVENFESRFKLSQHSEKCLHDNFSLSRLSAVHILHGALRNIRVKSRKQNFLFIIFSVPLRGRRSVQRVLLMIKGTSLCVGEDVCTLLFALSVNRKAICEGKLRKSGKFHNAIFGIKFLLNWLRSWWIFV